VHLWHAMLKDKLSASKFTKHFAMPWCYDCQSTVLAMMRHYVPDPLVSVIIDCRRMENITHTIQSVMRQKFPAWEIIVASLPGHDSCNSSALPFGGGGLGQQDRWRVRSIEVHAGRDFLNMGIREARGVWICVLAPGNHFGANYFGAAAEAMSTSPDLELIYLSNGIHDDTHSDRLVQGSTVLADGTWPSKPIFLRRLWTEDIAGLREPLSHLLQGGRKNVTVPVSGRASQLTDLL